MKFNKLIAAMLLPAALLCFSCDDEDDNTTPVIIQTDSTSTIDVNPSDQVSYLTIKIQVSLENIDGNTGLNNRTVTITSSDGKKLTAQTDENGLATFSNVVPGNYSAATSWSFTSDEYSALLGQQVSNNEYVVSGVLSEQLLSESNDEALKLVAKISIQQDILISKIYYSALKDNNDKAYKTAQFIELFNNSDKDVNVAGLYLGVCEHDNAAPFTYGADTTSNYLIQVFQIPTEEEKIVPAGGTVLIVNSAINHGKFCADGQDFSTADFEAKDEKNKITNNDKVKGLTLVKTSFAAITYIDFPVLSSFVIFRTDEDPTTWDFIYAEGKTKGTQYIKMPNKYTVDAVEFRTTKNDATVSEKRLYDFMDAGYITSQGLTSANAINSVTFVRKVKEKTSDGRIILQDTNNSTEDFEVKEGAKIREY